MLCRAENKPFLFVDTLASIFNASFDLLMLPAQIQILIQKFDSDTEVLYTLHFLGNLLIYRNEELWQRRFRFRANLVPIYLTLIITCTHRKCLDLSKKGTHESLPCSPSLI